MLARYSINDSSQPMPHPSAKTVDKFSDNCHKSSHSAQNSLQKNPSEPLGFYSVEVGYCTTVEVLHR